MTSFVEFADTSGRIEASQRWKLGGNMTLTDDSDGIPIINSTGGGASALDDLTDVTITSATTGDFLRYNGSQWVNIQLDTGHIASGTLGVTRGGTGVSDPTSGNILVGAGASAMTLLAPGASGGYVRSNGTAWVRSTIDSGDLPSHTHGKSDLPTAVAYEDEANVFTANQEIQKATPLLTLDATSTTGGALRFEESGAARARIRYGHASNWLVLATTNASATLTNRLTIGGEADSPTVTWSNIASMIVGSDPGGTGLVRVGGVLTLANDTWLTYRNTGGTGDIGILKVNATDDTILNADSGDNIQLQVGSTTGLLFDLGQLRVGRNDANAFDINFWINPSTANTELGGVVGQWNATDVAEMRFYSGDDTTNKDDGWISFLTASAGTLIERMKLQNDGAVVIASGSTLEWGGGAAITSSDDVLQSPVAETDGGTGQTTYTTGDILYSDATNSLAKLAKGTTNYVLKQGASVPAWGQVDWGELTGKPATFPPDSHTLTSHSDVDTTGVSTGDFLQYNGATWVDFDLFATANTWTGQQVFSGGVYNEDQPLILERDGTAYTPLFIYAWNETPRMIMYRAGGTKASPTAFPSGQVISIEFGGYDGAAWTLGAGIHAYSAALWDDTPAEHGMYLLFSTRDGSGAYTDRWRMTQTGHWVPELDSTYNIGSTAYAISNFYVDTITSIATNDLTLNAVSGQQIVFQINSATEATISATAANFSGTTMAWGGGSAIASSNDVLALPMANANWLTWRNVGDTADINVLRVDTNDDTVLAADSNDQIILSIGSNTWTFQSDADMVFPDDITRQGSAPVGKLDISEVDRNGPVIHGYADYTSTTGSAQGVEGYATARNTSGTLSLAMAVIGNSEWTAASGTGTITKLAGVRGAAGSSGTAGTITWGVAFDASSWNTGSATWTNFAAYYAPTQSPATNNWAFYAQSNNSYFGGDVQLAGGKRILRLDGAGDNFHEIRGDANRTGAGSGLFTLDGYWNGTLVSRIAFLSGADTTNKDDGRIQFRTATGGTLATAMLIEEDGSVVIGTDPTGSHSLRVGGNIAQGGGARLLEQFSTGADVHQIIQDSNRASANQTLGQLIGQWNNTNVTAIQSVTGADTTNKDDGRLRFQTATGGVLAQAMLIEEDGDVIIGATDPGGTETFRVGGSMNISGAIYDEGGVLLFGQDGSNNTRVNTASGTEIQFMVASSIYARVQSDGDFVIGTDPTGTDVLRVGGAGRFRATGACLTLEGTTTGDASTAWMEFEDDAGTRRGLVGDAASGDDDIYLLADTGAVRIRAASGQLIRLDDNNVANVTVGTDPGGTEKFRVGGNMRVEAGTATLIIESTTNDAAASLQIQGGPAGTLEGIPRILFYGRSDAIVLASDDSELTYFGFYSGFSSNRTYDAALRIYGSAASSWGTYLQLNHDGTDGRIATDTGDLVLAPAGGVEQAKLEFFPPEDKGSISANVDIDWSNGNNQYLTLTNTSSISISFSNVVQGAMLTLVIRRSSGSGALTGWSGVDWGTDSAPDVTTLSAGEAIVLVFFAHTTGEIAGAYFGSYPFTLADY